MASPRKSGAAQVLTDPALAPTPGEPASAVGEAAVESKPKDAKVSYMSLPNKGQLALLCLARVADPLAATSIQSYMFYQLKFFDPIASDATISAQAGIILGAKTAAQVCTGMLWGRVADAEWGGRRVVLVVGLLSSCIAYIGYGFSTTFASAVAWQIFSGVTNSNVAIVRCVVAELNPEKRYRTRALLLLPLSANAGMLMGPLVGGLLSSKTGESGLQSHPYALPNLVIGGVFLLAAVGVIFFLEETLEGLQGHNDSSPRRVWRRFSLWVKGAKSVEHEYAAIGADEPDTPSSPLRERGMDAQAPPTPPLSPPPSKARLPFWRIWTFNVVCTMLAQFIIAGHLGTFSALWAIFLSTPVGESDNQHPPLRFNGGVGMQPRDVGFAMSLLGVIGVILQAAVYPMLNDRFGTVQIWRCALFVFPVVYVIAPFLSLVASASSSTNGSTPAVWLAMAFVLLLFVLGRTGVTPATTLLINDCTPHPSVRGTIHTAGTVVGNLGRSIFPIVTLAIFGVGLRMGVVGLGFWCIACLAVLACIASRWVQEGSNGNEIKLPGDSARA